MAMGKNHRSKRLQLKGSLKKEGFDRWRLVTSGISDITGEEKTFSFEFYVLNPSVSPKEVVLGFKSRLSDDFQNAIAGSLAAKNSSTEILVVPSYVMVRAGVTSKNPIQVNAYYPADDVDFYSKEAILSVDAKKYKECILSDTYTRGSVSVEKAQIESAPEIMGNAGSISWDLKFSYGSQVPFRYARRNFSWELLCGKVDFSGKITLNGEDFVVDRKKSFGYFDKNYGKSFVSPFLHLSSSCLLSGISGKILENSYFAVQGDFQKKLSVAICLENRKILLRADGPRNYKVSYDCREIQGSDGKNKLHWSVSFTNRKYIVDIDVFADTKDLFIKRYEIPEGKRTLMSVLSSGAGYGKFSIYRRKNKSLELLEQVETTRCVAEYGNIEKSEI